jgi:RNA polymerase sigma-70 factor (ECF subfamily)
VTHRVDALVDRLFRRSAGRMVSALTRLLGPAHLDLAEEVVQDALLRALETWPYRGVPDNPGGWLMRVARNRALDVVRRRATLRRLEPLLIEPDGDAVAAVTSPPDDELAMIFMCCHPSISAPSRVALTLKTVGGFSVAEIARAFLAKPAAIAQRLVRAKRQIGEGGIEVAWPVEDMAGRLESVLDVIYLMFNEGYAASQGTALIRDELCHEAIRLAGLLLETDTTARPETHALRALMLLHASRLGTRADAEGVPLLLHEQERDRWDRDMIARGLHHLEHAAGGGRLTSYHIEAGIAACHATAPDYDHTDWRSIVRLYDGLLEINGSPVVRLNRAVAVGMKDGANAGLAALADVRDDAALAEYCLLPATAAEFHRRRGDRVAAVREYTRALALVRTEPERRFIERRLAGCRLLG